MIKLNTERLILRNFSKNDWKDLYEYLSVPSVAEYEPYDIFNEEECKKEAAKRSEKDNFIAVCLKDSGKLIGNIYFIQSEPKELMAWEIGYVFNPRFYGNGYATEACFAVLDYGFRNLGVLRTVAMCNPLNVRSWRLLERLNMRREGHLKKNIFFKRDSQGSPLWNDTYEYAILCEEWFESLK